MELIFKVRKINFSKCEKIFKKNLLLAEINHHMRDLHPHELGFICRRSSSLDSSLKTLETLDTNTKIDYIGKSNLRVTFFTGDLSKLSATDHLFSTDKSQSSGIVAATVNLNALSENDKMKVNITSSTSIPIISEIIHIDNF